eukprot:CAMPEP_0202853454 /NCGR_PEP_ID=MMETSP1389-20130828/90490_1 /ASSEMBLY_ACC=CAM_ASM_000865 /TAXON_ID=302021 /ORGANISM="Rhodomonas sp., Strain CCMP768" /LENGTH=178 /DNA_ID=CAMNT_0049532003 /DNA_START=183 /DNA_END=719 /DNA_ORIENTATION=-
MHAANLSVALEVVCMDSMRSQPTPTFQHSRSFLALLRVPNETCRSTGEIAQAVAEGRKDEKFLALLRVPNETCRSTGEIAQAVAEGRKDEKVSFLAFLFHPCSLPKTLGGLFRKPNPELLTGYSIRCSVLIAVSSGRLTYFGNIASNGSAVSVFDRAHHSAMDVLFSSPNLFRLRPCT